ncbi:MAG: alpha/beta hydrolase [Cyanobacteria bacterium P01_A01_bin.45]
MQDWWQATFPQGKQYLTISDACGYPVKIAYGEKGKGKPLFLLHGVGSWSYNWRNSVEALSKYFRVICFDAKGFGFSEKPLYRQEIPGHQAIEFERIICQLCDEPVIIVAESLGALISLAIAQNNPQLIASMVVINLPVFAEDLPHWGMKALSMAPLEVIKVIDYLRLTYWFAPLVRKLIETERREVLFDPSILTKKDIYWITYPFIKIPGTLSKAAEELQIAAQEINKSRTNKGSWLTQIQDKLHLINSPVLILWGEYDSWFPPSHGEKLNQYLPNSKLQIIPKCGHDASTGATKIINQAVIDFLIKKI